MNKIPTSTPTFLTMPSSMEHVATFFNDRQWSYLWNGHGKPISRWKITPSDKYLNWTEISSKFQCLPHIFGHVQPNSASVNVSWCLVDDWNSVGEPISRWKSHSTGHISGLDWDIMEIQKPTRHFWPCLVQLSMCWCFPMLVDDRDCVRVGNPAPGGKITPLGIFKKRKEISSKFQNLSPHFRPCPTSGVAGRGGGGVQRSEPPPPAPATTTDGIFANPMSFFYASPSHLVMLPCQLWVGTIDYIPTQHQQAVHVCYEDRQV